jgi:hypothetical protein
MRPSNSIPKRGSENFISHRLREAMRDGTLLPPMGGEGAVVEVDETFIGKKADVPKRRGYAHKHAVLSSSSEAARSAASTSTGRGRRTWYRS